MTINLKHKESSITKSVPVGFSWTTFFFGCIPAFLRGDVKWGCIMLGLAIITCGLSWFIFPFVYNKLYTKSLLEKGYIPTDEGSKQILISKGFQFTADIIV